MWGFFLRYIYIIIHENAEYHLPYSNFYTQTIKFTNIKLQAIHCFKISQQSTPPIQKPLINPQLHRCLNSTFPRQPLPSAAVFSEKVSRRRKISHQIPCLSNGDKTQKLWKPLLTQFSLSEAYWNGLDKGIRWDIFSPPASPLNPLHFVCLPTKPMQSPQDVIKYP